MINSKKKINYILVLSCLFFAVFVRAYNIDYDDLWFDEISSFWVSDPEISFQESLIRHKNIEKTPFLYFSILKINFDLFSSIISKSCANLAKSMYSCTYSSTFKISLTYLDFIVYF